MDLSIFLRVAWFGCHCYMYVVMTFFLPTHTLSEFCSLNTSSTDTARFLQRKTEQLFASTKLLPSAICRAAQGNRIINEFMQDKDDCLRLTTIISQRTTRVVIGTVCIFFIMATSSFLLDYYSIFMSPFRKVCTFSAFSNNFFQ